MMKFFSKALNMKRTSDKKEDDLDTFGPQGDRAVIVYHCDVSKISRNNPFSSLRETKEKSFLLEITPKGGYRKFDKTNGSNSNSYSVDAKYPVRTQGILDVSVSDQFFLAIEDLLIQNESRKLRTSGADISIRTSGSVPISDGEKVGLLSCPFEILVEIMQYVDFRDLCRLSQSCKDVKEVSEDDSLWMRLCTLYGYTLNNTKSRWKNFFVKEHKAKSAKQAQVICLIGFKKQNVYLNFKDSRYFKVLRLIEKAFADDKSAKDIEGAYNTDLSGQILIDSITQRISRLAVQTKYTYNFHTRMWKEKGTNMDVAKKAQVAHKADREQYLQVKKAVENHRTTNKTKVWVRGKFPFTSEPQVYLEDPGIDMARWEVRTIPRERFYVGEIWYLKNGRVMTVNVYQHTADADRQILETFFTKLQRITDALPTPQRPPKNDTPAPSIVLLRFCYPDEVMDEPGLEDKGKIRVETRDMRAFHVISELLDKLPSRLTIDFEAMVLASTGNHSR
eukprot:TRINITY_DN8323_c0_g1_i3.p1 TRINITY_DN8323_c0_g1~~TRINITY_DN8323_c0_g1_i3.p1  ORF type:complete len:505 (-),score=106.79 TRINITY_DN8323_c0_g1_i3:39-1553(-)